MASEKEKRGASSASEKEETPGVPQAQGKGAAPGEEAEAARKKEPSLPEHRTMSVRRDLGEGDIDVSRWEDEMSHEPSRS
ncbi:hypothetical protein [Myxococcus sp. RHSTA-1-4]|uniref:hypothetical protein n=1 Tax=Myxococcus sp. RHSTA-1-4 TaxID=2874601 RepID=UPI001CBF1F2D|nr:hypothetical protein [Myxococcus sp. RHSTA-1-4]MBZ4416473.1 hypothetical protein [Myxococcus sp. RHSTA-1-4]